MEIHVVCSFFFICVGFNKFGLRNKVDETNSMDNKYVL